MFRLGSHKRASDYNKAFEEICNSVRAKCKMPEDFLEAFEAREEIDWESKKPILKVESPPNKHEERKTDSLSRWIKKSLLAC